MNLVARAIFISGIALATPLLAQDPPAPDAPSPSEPVDSPEPVVDPEAKRILARAVDAIGGEKHRASVQSSRSVAQLETDTGSTKFELLAMRPNKFLVRQSIKGLGQMEMGYDGETGWRKDPPDGLIAPLDSEYALAFGNRFDLQALIRNLDLRFPNQAIAEPVELEGVNCDAVKLDDGETVLIAYFDSATGLPKALEIPNDKDSSPARRITIEEWHTDARPLRWARTIRVEQNRQTMRAVYSSVSFDDVSETTFQPPVALDNPLQPGVIAE